MAGAYGSGQQGNRLLGQLLALFDSLGGGQRHIDCAFLFGLFAVDLGPLILMPDRQQRSAITPAHASNSSVPINPATQPRRNPAARYPGIATIAAAAAVAIPRLIIAEVATTEYTKGS